MATNNIQNNASYNRYSEQNAELANMIRKDPELSDAVRRLTQLNDVNKKTAYDNITALLNKQNGK